MLNDERRMLVKQAGRPLKFPRGSSVGNATQGLTLTIDSICFRLTKVAGCVPVVFLLATTVACTDVLYYQETPIRGTDLEMVKNAATIHVATLPWYGTNLPDPLPPEAKFPVGIMDVQSGRYAGSQTNLTKMVPVIFRGTVPTHPTEGLKDRLIADLSTRIPNVQFAIMQQSLEVPVSGSVSPRTSAVQGLLLDIKTSRWEFIIGNNVQHHLTYFARVRLLDMTNDRILWVQTCNGRESWPGRAISAMDEEEVRSFVATFQGRAQHIIDECSEELVRHLFSPL